MASQIPQLYIVDALGNVYGYLCLNTFSAEGIPLTYTLNGDSTLLEQSTYTSDGSIQSESPTSTLELDSPGVSSTQTDTEKVITTAVKKSKSKESYQCDRCKTLKGKKCFGKDHIVCNRCLKKSGQSGSLSTPY
jgi:hypothetical protein